MMLFNRRWVRRGIQVCLFSVRLLLLGIVTLVLLIGVAWAFGAVWFDFPFPVLRRPLAVAFGLAGTGMLVFLRPRYERDIVRVRTNIRREAVYLYHLIPATPERHSYIDYRARDADDDPSFSSLNRKGLPGMP